MTNRIPITPFGKIIHPEIVVQVSEADRYLVDDTFEGLKWSFPFCLISSAKQAVRLRHDNLVKRLL